MIDINNIRKNKELFERAIKRKRVQLDLNHLLTLDQQRRELQAINEDLRKQRNALSARTKDIQPVERETHLAQCTRVAKQLGEQEKLLTDLSAELNALILTVPNPPGEDVPDGDKDEDNKEVDRWGGPPTFAFEPKDHIELARKHGLVDFDNAKEFAGSRAVALMGDGALLEMAVLRFALDRLLEFGFTPVVPPVVVRHGAMLGTGYFPTGKDDAYALERDDMFLAGTSEVPLIAMHAGKTYGEADLPLRLAGVSPCFRREAGAAGRDTKGLYRVHQFQKVEQVLLVPPDEKAAEEYHWSILNNAREILKALELPHRVVNVCAGELGLGHIRRHDIETWMPSRNAYCETHSCSNLGDFQARRMNIRFVGADGTKGFVHTLNNTAIASPRILIPLLENHQRADGTIHIPPALRPYMGGRIQIG